jgi:hypothetical protein
MRVRENCFSAVILIRLTRPKGGTTVGSANVYLSGKREGGTIWVESEEGKGLRFPSLREFQWAVLFPSRIRLIDLELVGTCRRWRRSQVENEMEHRNNLLERAEFLVQLRPGRKAWRSLRGPARETRSFHLEGESTPACRYARP